ncbi:MAG: hypothetical protein ACK5SI_02405, partial [Planctomycetia bacterium]
VRVIRSRAGGGDGAIRTQGEQSRLPVVGGRRTTAHDCAGGQPVVRVAGPGRGFPVGLPAVRGLRPSTVR